MATKTKSKNAAPATQLEIKDWFAENAERLEQAGVKAPGQRGRLHPTLIAAFQLETGREFGGYVNTVPERTLKFRFKTPKGGHVTREVPASEVRKVAAQVGAAKANSRGRLPADITTQPYVITAFATQFGLHVPDSVKAMVEEAEHVSPDEDNE